VCLSKRCMRSNAARAPHGAPARGGAGFAGTFSVVDAGSLVAEQHINRNQRAWLNSAWLARDGWVALTGWRGSG